MMLIIIGLVLLALVVLLVLGCCASAGWADEQMEARR